MPDVITAGAPPAAAATQTPTTPTTAADVANANALNQALSAIRQSQSANTAAIIAKINAIASAITNSMVGGTTGTAANHVLISKGTTGFAMQPSSVVTVDSPSGALQISNAATGSTTEAFRVKPTDYATGKPYLALRTGVSATEWQMIMFDGTTIAGTLSALTSIVQHKPQGNQSASLYLQTAASDSHFIALLPSNGALGYNNLVQAGDQSIIYSGGAADNGTIVFGPWSSITGGAGFRMDSAGISRYATEAGFVEQTLTDAATIAWNLNTQQSAGVTLAGNRTMGTPTNPVPGFTYILVVAQDATGNRTLSFPNPPFKWSGGTTPVLSTGANAVDLFSFYCHTTSFIMGSLLKAFS